eukprot:XP_002258062.1 hypothetical protein, conserved in Plasmodium species [Plasmodium knowlesi strain H]
MWNIFSNEDLSLRIEKREEESSEKKTTKKKGLETVSNKNELTQSRSPGFSISNHDSKIANKAYDIKIKELRKNFRKKYRIVRTQLLKIIKIVKQFPQVDAEKDNSERDNFQGNNTDKEKGVKKKKDVEGITYITPPDGSDNETIIVQVELIKKLNKIIEKIDVEQLKAKRRIKGKKNSRSKKEEEGLKNKPRNQTFTSKTFSASAKNDSHKCNIKIVKKFSPKSAKNFQHVISKDICENAGGIISLQNKQNSLKNEHFQNSDMKVYSKKNNEGNVYHDTDDIVVTDFYMYSSTLNAGSSKKKKKSRWLGDNMNDATTNDNGVYGGNSYNHSGGNNYGYSDGNYCYANAHYDHASGNYDYEEGSFNCNYGSHNYNGGNYASGTYISGSYNYEANNNAPFRAKKNYLTGNSNQEKGAGNKSFFQNMPSESYMQSFKGGMLPHYEPQNLHNVVDACPTRKRNKRRNMNNRKKGYKFAKDEKIRGLLRTATNEDDLVKAIGFAKSAGLHFEAKLGSKKLNKLKLEGEDGASLEV